jgi:hypothetical protein
MQAPHYEDRQAVTALEALIQVGGTGARVAKHSVQFERPVLVPAGLSASLADQLERMWPVASFSTKNYNVQDNCGTWGRSATDVQVGLPEADTSAAFERSRVAAIDTVWWRRTMTSRSRKTDPATRAVGVEEGRLP